MTLTIAGVACRNV